jgi:hypothetical protein
LPLAAANTAGDEDVAAGADGGGEGGAVAGGEDAGLDVLVEGVDDGGGFAEVEDGGGGERRDEALEAGVAEELQGELGLEGGAGGVEDGGDAGGDEESGGAPYGSAARPTRSNAQRMRPKTRQTICPDDQP